MWVGVEGEFIFVVERAKMAKSFFVNRIHFAENGTPIVDAALLPQSPAGVTGFIESFGAADGIQWGLFPSLFGKPTQFNAWAFGSADQMAQRAA